mmetsp:Transcript_5307/g.12662  ORF Transcript_5307/g.12662 Transcript_5307/m.12662 type:complete len:166 (+) Transcript_5307:418-915(+)
MAMLASAEIAMLAKKFAPQGPPSPRILRQGAAQLGASLLGRGQPPAGQGRLVAHKLYTFAAPRIGNEVFARSFAKAFCQDESYWAVQSGGDAVPHLPLQSMGFRHPPGRIITLNKYRRFGAYLDAGDDTLGAWVPRGGDPQNWVRTHDVNAYSMELALLMRDALP